VTPSGKGGAQVELPGEIFEAKVNIPLIHQVVVAQEAAARQGTHATKTRGMVRGGGKKPYRQKGTGRARQGSLRAPQYAGGGTVHGPVPRSYAQRTPKKMKAAALRGALSDRAGHGRLAVVSAFVEGGVPSTKEALTVLRTAVGATAARFARPVLVVVHADDEMTRKSLRNVPHVRVLDSGQLNTYDVLACDHVVFTQAALAEFVARAGGGELVTVDKPAAKQARASTRKAAAGDDGEPAPEAGETKAAAGDDGEPGPEAGVTKAAAGDDGKPGPEAGATKAAAGDDGKPGPEAGATKAAAEDGGEPGAEGTDEAKPARASRARKPATAGAGKPADGEESDAGPTGVTQRSSGTSGETASSGSGAEQKEEQE
jgi:large subunit ribosomal protein L4